MPTALRPTEPRFGRDSAEAASRPLETYDWYDADAISFRGADDPSPDVARRIDALRSANPGTVDHAREAERAGLPRR